MKDLWEEVKSVDPEIYEVLHKELERQRNGLELIASENFVSKAVLQAMGSVLTNKYAEGYPAKRYYGGCEIVDIAENLARDRACQLFGADHANVQPHSGSQANMAAYMSIAEPGSVMMGLSLTQGGHLTHGSPVNFSGKLYKVISYGLNPDTETIDYDQVKKLAIENKPKVIITGGSAYPRTIDFKKFREIADEVGAYLVVDMAHFAGLVAAKIHPNPVEYAHIVTSTTHKTLRGPRGGLILSKEEFAKQIDKTIFPGIQGGPLMHVIAAKAVCFKEAMMPEFKNYQSQIVKNAAKLASSLSDRKIRIVSGGTDTHLMLVDLVDTGLTGKEVENLLGEVGITVNKNTIPREQRSPTVTSGIRIGTPAVTTRGMKEAEMEEIADIIASLIHNPDDQTKRISRERVEKICKRFPLYPDIL